METKKNSLFKQFTLFPLDAFRKQLTSCCSELRQTGPYKYVIKSCRPNFIKPSLSMTNKQTDRLTLLLRCTRTPHLFF